MRNSGLFNRGLYLKMTVTSPGHYECECGPHGLALAIKVIFWHLIQSLVWVHHLPVYLLRQSEGLLKCRSSIENQGSWTFAAGYLRWGEHCFMNMLCALFAHADWNAGMNEENIIWRSKAENDTYFLNAASWWSNFSLVLFPMALLKSFLCKFQRLLMITMAEHWLFWSDDFLCDDSLTSVNTCVWSKKSHQLHCALCTLWYHV